MIWYNFLMIDLYSKWIVEYCERSGNGFFSEPLNLLSNIAMLVSAYLIFLMFRSSGLKNKKYWIFFYLVLLIGIGSSLWHSFRTSFTHALDAVPIYLFLLTFLYFYLRNFLKTTFAIVVTALFLAFQVTVSIYLPEFANGSIRHLVNASTFVVLALLFYRRKKKISIDFIIALVAYSLGILFRSIDSAVCKTFPLGTHFLWHIFTPIAVYFSVKGLLDIQQGKNRF